MNDMLVNTPLRLEALVVRTGAPRLRIQTTGMGPMRSKAAIPLLRADPADTLVVMGVCGGLDQECEPGDIVIADELLDGEDPESRHSIACPSAEPLAKALEHHGLPVHRGTVISVGSIARRGTRATLRERGATVVDMESVWLADGARGRPLAVIRVVADTPSREVTRPLLTFVGAGRAALSLRRAAAALEALVRERGAHAVLGGG